jgi:Domain of unknown function (DUF4833)
MSTRASRRVFFVAAAAAASLALSAAHSARAEGLTTLFQIERSKNTNEIHYAAQVGKDGALDTKEPVSAFWVMKAEDGRREGLNFMERKMAYGFDIKPSGAEWDLKLVAAPDRTIKLTSVGGRWRAQTTLNGKPAYLKRIFIQTKEGGVVPTVVSVDLFGDDVASGKAVQEHVNK